MNRIDDEIQHQVLDDKQTEDWRKMSGKVILFSHYDTEKDLREDWANFNDQPVDHQREANWKSIEIYGFPNQDRYEKMLSEFLKQPIEDDLEEFRYSPKTINGKQSKFIESLKNYAKNNDMVTALETANYLKNIVHNAYKEIQEGIKEQLSNDNDVNFSLVPYFTPSELKFLGLSYIQGPSKYSDEPDTVLIGDISTKEWINEYENRLNGISSDNDVSFSTWKEAVQDLYLDYDEIKESDDINKINSRKQSILDIGWNPEIPFNESTIDFAAKRVSKIINETNNNFKIINISNTNAISESAYSNSQKEQPIFIIFYSLYAKDTVKYDHIGLSFTYSLDEIYGYKVPGANVAHKTTLLEIQEGSTEHIEVYAVFLKPDEIDKIKNMITKKEDSDFLYFNIDGKDLVIDNIKTVCDSFITNIMNKLYKTDDMQTNIEFSGNIYKVYHGDPDIYDSTKTVSSIAHLYAGAVEESSSFIYRLAIKETKDFPIQFNKDGDLLISKGKNLDFEGEYSRTHMALQQYEKAKNVEGMKYCLCKLWYMNIILEENIHDYSDNKEKIKEYHKARAKIINDIKKYMKIVLKQDDKFDMLKEYQNSPFNDDTIRIKRSTLLYTIDLFKQILSKI